MKNFWLCFVPLFFAVDAIGILPLFINLTEGLSKKRKKNVLFQSILTASAVAIVFLFVGPELMKVIGVSVSDFMIAGGILLLTIALTDLTRGEKLTKGIDRDTLGAVPLGVPLITGPAVLTTSIILVNAYGVFLTAIAVILNILFAGLIFEFSIPISKFLGQSGTKTLSKIASLFLASIAIMLLRKGVIEIIKTYFNL
ncbi:MAG: MarC family protein [candidate division WOR-3 bacterium]